MISDVKTILQSRGIKIQEKRSRDDYIILCPFHDDKNASCHVHKQKGFFHCWSCGERGSIAKLVARVDGISEKEAWAIINGDESSAKVLIIKNQEEKKEKLATDPLVEKYYEAKELLRIWVSRKDLRLARELNRVLRGENIWEFFRAKQKKLKENPTVDDYLDEIKFEYITSYIEEQSLVNPYSQFIKMLKEYNFDTEYSLVIELMNNEKYQDFKKEQQIVKELNFRIYEKIKPELDKNFDNLFV